jgi:iron(II)-dependent oxidoreductase
MRFNFLLVLTALFTGSAIAQDDPLAKNAPEGMVYVPAGEFTMGSSRGDMHGTHDIRLFSDAQPEHKANVSAFYIDKTEVTNAQYKKFCDAAGYPAPPHWKNGSYPQGEADVAVTRVNWWEASAYAAWAGKRLPTEAEWEKTARGTDARQFPWGNAWDAERVITRQPKPQVVGQKPAGASPYGALDLTGNVFEWVDNWYLPYPGSTQQLPEFGKQYKVLRGGGFDALPGFPAVYNTAYRSVSRPQTRSEWIGFRCAKDAK